MRISDVGMLEQPASLPPLWIVFYLGSILAASWAGSTTDMVAGTNVEHVLLGGSFGMAVAFLFFEGNLHHVCGLSRLSKYLVLFGLAIFLGFLSSIGPGPEIVGAKKLLYWCGLVVSMGVAALAAMRGYTRWVLAAIVLGGIPLIASTLLPFFPFLAKIVPAAKMQAWFMGRATGLFVNPNSTGFVLYCCFAGCLCLYCDVRSFPAKLMLLGLCAICSASIFLTLSRASVLIMALTALSFLFILWRRNSHRWLILMTAIAVAIVAHHRVASDGVLGGFEQTRLLERELYEGDTFRFQGLLTAAQHFGGLLFLGEGTNQFVMVSGAYVDAWEKAPHNQILGIWVEWGFLALILMYSAHAWVILSGLTGGLWRKSDTEKMLLAAYVSILLYLQLHEVNSPASCALLGLAAGWTFRGRHCAQNQDDGTDSGLTASLAGDE